MRAMQLNGFGGLEQLQMADIPQPTPQADEVLVRVGACGLNNTDLNLRKGWYGAQGDSDDQTGWNRTAPNFPLIQGADIVGEVVAVGEGVDAGRISQRVMVNPTVYTAGEDNPTEFEYIGSERNGGFAEYVAVPSANAHAVNSPLSDVELATFPTSYLTAEHMLSVANVQAGETVLITGASGGVGSALIQLVQARGATAIAIVSASKTEQAQALGAAHVIPRDTGDLAAALDGHTVDAVADMVGGTGFGGLLEAVRVGGRVVTCGAIGGADVTLDLRIVYLRHLTLIGSTLGTASDFAALVRYIERGAIRPLVAATYPLEQMHAAQTAFDAKGFFGKIVIRVAK